MEYRELAETLVHHMEQMRGNPEPKNLGDFLRGEWMVLVYLGGTAPVRPGELGETLGASSAHIAKILRNLESKGLVIRKADAADRRCSIVELTGEGQRLLQEKWEEVLSNIAAGLEALGEEDARQLVRIIGRVATWVSASQP